MRRSRVPLSTSRVLSLRFSTSQIEIDGCTLTAKRCRVALLSITYEIRVHAMSFALAPEHPRHERAKKPFGGAKLRNHRTETFCRTRGRPGRVLSFKRQSANAVPS